MRSMLIYLHGFNSSPLSTKLLQLKKWCKLNRFDIQFEAPALPTLPQQVVCILEKLIQQYSNNYRIGLVGSSLGGYYATWLNQRYGFRTVVVNPAVAPYVLLRDYLGSQEHPYTGERYVLTEQHMLDLNALEVQEISKPKSIWLLQQQGDEVLDYQQAVKKYHRCTQTVEAKGNHAFVGFERFCSDIVQFLEL